MWGQIYVDYALHRNFNVGFSSHKNDIHLHLSQWQYWWWFWFALVWSLYFLIIIRIVVFGTENYKNTLNTSLRSHGKWGDFLVALIPLSWCGNILINSNFILRMIEWQNESSLFVVRIQGKQWYWVYKYNSDTNYRLQNLYINVGSNNWFKTANPGTKMFNANNSTLFYLYEYEFKKTHKAILEKNNKIASELMLNSFNINWSYMPNSKITRKKNYIINNILLKYMYYDLDSTPKSNLFEWKLISNRINMKLSNILNFSNIYENLGSFNENNSFNTLNTNNLNISSNYEIDKMEDVEETLENIRTKVNNFPIKLLKGVLNKHNVSLLSNNVTLNKNILFSYRLNNDSVVGKIPQVEQFWGFRQKKYKKLRSFFFTQNNRFSNSSYQPIANFVNNENFNKYNLYTGFKNNKNKGELINVTLSRRLLRTKRTLLLPVHINITVIASSYDVVHSWFVPGLGLKIDCVPGRSNHLTLYIDNVGFYYGQCAEICGRYHHHMPIRVCALNYEHFLLWWQTKGLPRMYRSNAFTKKKVFSYISLNKYWYTTLHSGL